MSTNENNSVLAKALTVIDYLGNKTRTVSIQEISDELNFPAATVYRILQTLKNSGYVEQFENKQYALSYKILELSSNVVRQNRLVECLLPFMNYFSSQADCQVGLSAFYRGSIIHLATVGTHIAYNDKFALPGSVLPVYCSAAGKVFLSHLSEEELDEWISNACLIPYTVHTIIDPEKLREDIQKTRVQGYGITIAELYEFMSCVSVPVFNQKDQVVGALNFATNPEKFDNIYNDKFINNVKSALEKVRI